MGFFFFSSRRRHTRSDRDWSSDVCSSDLLADGRAYTGRQALKLGLVDAIGGEHDARLWLADEKGISADLPVEDVSTSSLAARAFSSSLGWMFDALWKSLFSQGVILDGTRLVWQRF